MSRFRDRDRVEPLQIGRLVPKVYPSKEPDEIRAIRAFRWWEKAVPRRVLENARPVRASRGVLTIHVSTSVWAHELEMLKPQLIESLARHAPQAGVRDLRIRVGPLPPLVVVPVRERRRTPVIPVTELPEELARALAAVGDDGVREAVAEAAGISLGAAKQRRPKAPR
jgi:hypothetical protein